MNAHRPCVCFVAKPGFDGRPDRSEQFGIAVVVECLFAFPVAVGENDVTIVDVPQKLHAVATVEAAYLRIDGFKELQEVIDGVFPESKLYDARNGHFIRIRIGVFLPSRVARTQCVPRRQHAARTMCLHRRLLPGRLY